MNWFIKPWLYLNGSLFAIFIKSFGELKIRTGGTKALYPLYVI